MNLILKQMPYPGNSVIDLPGDVFNFSPDFALEFP